MMRLWIYLGMLASVGGVLGVSAAGGLRPQVQPAAKTWRAIGAMQPRLSPDGESIAFACQCALWRIPRAGGVMRRLTSEPAWDSYPAWSPDGKKIAFLSAGLIQLLDADSGVVSPLPARISARDALYFHPDGKRLIANCRAANGYAL